MGKKNQDAHPSRKENNDPYVKGGDQANCLLEEEKPTFHLKLKPWTPQMNGFPSFLRETRALPLGMHTIRVDIVLPE